MNDFHPMHESEWRSNRPRLETLFDAALITVLALAVIASATAAVVVVKLFPWGLA